jgi:hypothetical protein
MTALSDPVPPAMTRLMAGAGLTSGALLLVRPRRAVETLAPAFPRERLWLVRLLGARLLAQHGAVLVSPSAQLLRLGSAVDLLHAASVVPFVASPRYGAAARISGGLAAAYAAVALAIARRSNQA